MILALILSYLTAIFSSAFFFVISSQMVGCYLFVAVIIYLFRFDLRHLGWRYSWLVGLWLDLFSGAHFGTFILICFILSSLADWLITPSDPRYAPNAVWLCLVGTWAIATLMIHSLGFPLHVALSQGVWSALITTVVFWVADQLTVKLRLYD